jgi:predicted naringenin-chalcone synthase
MPVQCCFAKETLSSVGNLSSSSVLFVLKRFLDSSPYHDGDYALMLGVGPGLTIELILFQVQE